MIRCLPPRDLFTSKQWEYKPTKELTRNQKNSWPHYKWLRATHDRYSGLAMNALQSFLDINFQYSSFRQLAYEEEILNKCLDKPKLFHAYIRGKKVGCLTVGYLYNVDIQ